MNFSSEHLESLFIGDDYKIIPVKGVGIFEPKLWLCTFKKSLTRNIIEAKIVYTSMGLTLPIKRYAASPLKQTVEFAGLHAYNEKSRILKELLESVLKDAQEESISRIDVAIDFKGKVPSKVIKALSRSRTPFKWINTTYNKSPKEKSTNNTLDIKIYNKTLKENLDYELERLEFAFKGQYFNKMQVKEIDKAYKKMQKSIKRFSGLEAEILPLKVTL